MLPKQDADVGQISKIKMVRVLLASKMKYQKLVAFVVACQDMADWKMEVTVFQ